MVSLNERLRIIKLSFFWYLFLCRAQWPPRDPKLTILVAKIPIFHGFWVSHLRSFPPSCRGTLNVWEMCIQSSKVFTITFVQGCITENIYHKFCGGAHANLMISRFLGTPFLEHFWGPGGAFWHQFGGYLVQGCAQKGP